MIRFIFILLLLLKSVLPVKAQMIKLDSLQERLTHSTEDSNKVKILGEIASEYYEKSDYLQTMFYAEMLHKLSKRIQYKKGIIRYYNISGRIQKNLGNYIESQEKYFQALKMSEEIKDVESIAGSCNNLGNLFILQKKNVEAMRYLQTSLYLYDALHLYKKKAYPISNIAKLFQNEKKYDTAEIYFRKAMQYAKQYDDYYEMAQNYKRLTSLEIIKKNYAHALQLSDSSLQISNKYKYRYMIGDMYDIQGLMHYELKDYTKSRYYYLKAKNIYDELKVKPSIVNSYKQLYKLDSIMGNYKASFEHLKLYELYRDSLSSTDKIVDLERERVKHEAEKNELIIKSQQMHERETYTTNRNLLLLTLLLLSVGFLIFYFFNKEKQKLKNKLSVLQTKNTISKDLHDEIGSALSSISMQTEVLKKRLRNQEPLTDLIENISQTSKNTMSDMSDIVWSLNPMNDNLNELVNRVQTLGAMVLSPNDILLHVDILPKLASHHLNSSALKGLFMIIKEALANSMKYAHCKNIWLRFYEENNKLCMSIIDDGTGFDIHQHKLNLGGEGLKNMKERAAKMNATLQMHSQENRGTSIVVKLTLDS